MKGNLIVLEGIDGAGKSTHLDFICEQIRALKKVEVLLTREPGGTPLAEKIRELVLHEPMDVETEVLLVMAARKEHVQSRIRPALEEGKWVVCDRFIDSTRAYQGGGGGVSLRWIDELNAMATGGLAPDRVYLFDIPSELAAQRRGGRASASDRFEEQGVEYFDRVREVYLNKPRMYSEGQTLVVDAQQSIEAIREILRNDIQGL